MLPLQNLKYLFFLSLILFSVCGNAQKVEVKTKGYGAASYSSKQTDAFLKTWLLLDPISIKNSLENPTEEFQKQIFNEEEISSVLVKKNKKNPPVKIKDKKFFWKEYSSTSDSINLEKAFSKMDYAYSYALAEITSDSAMPVLLALGSDDGIKVWLNGKQVHSNWMARGIIKDNDLVVLKLEKGSNQLLLKVQDIVGGWGFMARLYDQKLLDDQVIRSAEQGNIEKINTLLNAGAKLNPGEGKYSALHAARIAGQTDAENLLLQKGAQNTAMPSVEEVVSYFYKPNSEVGPGVSLLVSKDAEIIYDHAYGYADLENKKRITSQTKFRIGSITKQFIGAAILKLQEQGMLNVQDKLSKFLPDFPRANEVTIHQLLTHTSGIHSYTQNEDFLKRVIQPASIEEVINYFRNNPYDFNPGEQYRYNNSGYFLLGYIIEKASAKPYADYLKQVFFDPLKMTNTGIYNNASKLKNEAKGYTTSGVGYKPALNWDMSWAAGAGGMYSTTEDLFKWNEGLFNGKILNDASLKLAFKPVVLNNGKTPQGIDYGYGWTISKYRGMDEIGHGGWVDGFTSQLVRYPKENFTVVILTNITPPEVNMDPNKFAEIFLWDKMEKKTSSAEINISEEELKLFVGRYDLPGGVMNISVEGNKLFGQLTGQNKYQLFPSSDSSFFLKVVDAKIIFHKDGSGIVKSAKLLQNGKEIVMNKLKEESVAVVDSKIYDQYVGKYDLGNNFIITIIREQNKIFEQATNQPRLEIFPTSENEFFLKEVNAKISFVKDTSGKFSKLVLKQNGLNIEGKRME